MKSGEEKVTAWVELPASWGAKARRLVFGRPYARWWADELEAVQDALERVEIAQKLGHYVVGFVSYEAAGAFDRALETHGSGGLPYCFFASYPQPLSAPPLWSAPSSIYSEDVRATVRVAEADYRDRVGRALDSIRKGDIYQVNFTVRAEVELPGDPFDFFRARLRAAPMPHAAYLSTGALRDEPGLELVSLSPELYLRRRGEVIESRPMKGTAARRPSWVDDEAAWRALGLSEKERAENIMITDLVRNDLGRLCAAGTVEAPVLCEVARHPTVHQMTSLVRGILRPGRSLYEIFAATFPPGSVTGAPKVRAMQIIKELEPERRGVYCGTVGVFFPHGDFELNVGIRTVEIRNKKQGARIKSRPSLFVPSSLFPVSSVLGLGSGIVADSDAGAEWREVWLKSRFLTVAALPEFDLLETLRWTDQDGFVNLRCHLRRMRCSATYFGWRFPLVKIIAELRTLASGYFSAPKSIETGERRVRILLTKTGDVRVETQPFGPWPERAVKIFVYEDERVDAEDILLYHKTTARGIYERALAAARAAGCDEAVLVNSRGEITEGTISSVFVKRGGEWWTPALACGLLPGIYRELELAAGRCREAVLSVEDLREAEEVVVGNSGRGGSAGSKIRA